MSIRSAFIFLGALCAAPAYAQAAPAPAAAPAVDAPAPERVAAATKLLEVMMPPSQREAMMGQIVGATMSNIMGGFNQQPGLQEALKNPKVKAVFDRFIARQQQLAVADVKQQLPGLFDAMARAYARRFTVAEMGEVEAFFATPTGQKYAVESVQVMNDPDVAAWQAQSVAKSMERLPAELQRFREELQAAGAASGSK
ncbi:DUF2059 domain-containing protein [Sphingopyxis sp. MWB1]|uniref:DUF2059 domain-containing protein n=1 Tax=Sphingopyxis sp. MWB1 TaxID=1537715 RepID=UPI00051A1615|nr:DUF2059 domain-containing protein [Sphingopyxis sp. MWB1]